jgi:hypothetical protein
MMNLTLTQTKAVAAAKSTWKYLFWTVVAAVLRYVIDNLFAFKIPELYVPLIGAVLKGIATWVATQCEGVLQ